MMKARLIKRHEAQEAINSRRAKKIASRMPTAKKPMQVMQEWVEQQRAARPDPRQAFAALFAQPQN